MNNTSTRNQASLIRGAGGCRTDTLGGRDGGVGGCRRAGGGGCGVATKGEGSTCEELGFSWAPLTAPVCGMRQMVGCTLAPPRSTTHLSTSVPTTENRLHKK
ncbi:hypothetical protein Pmani_030801 [Petrolisthes manimaculis]|uniref:Uncharacterized protein n=1 Tax=Petrolisthes manimaculis TaxID=1843537 RepID=A0AAE1NVX3_9EUCA|nr:hypothetical protein Pmani_030801 [Petrolisthes manimaculis]